MPLYVCRGVRALLAAVAIVHIILRTTAACSKTYSTPTLIYPKKVLLACTGTYCTGDDESRDGQVQTIMLYLYRVPVCITVLIIGVPERETTGINMNRAYSLFCRRLYWRPCYKSHWQLDKSISSTLVLTFLFVMYVFLIVFRIVPCRAVLFFRSIFFLGRQAGWEASWQRSWRSKARKSTLGSLVSKIARVFASEIKNKVSWQQCGTR